MRKKSKNKALFLTGQLGCLIPLLILTNLFFGLLFFKPFIWLLVGAVLVLLFILNTYIIVRKMSSFFSEKDNVIDVEGEAIEEKDQLT